MKKIFGKSGIYIKPENKGKFTKWAKSKNMSVQEAANTVMSNPEEYSSTIVKRANFAKNAAGWKHANGGYVITDPPTNPPGTFMYPRPTAQDSMDVYNRAVELDNFYKKNKDYKLMDLLSIAFKDKDPLVYRKYGSRREKDKDGKYTEIFNTFKEDLDYDFRNYKLPDPENEEKRKYYKGDKKFEGRLSNDNYRKPVDKNKPYVIEQREKNFGVLNLNAPYGYYDTRIEPQGLNYYLNDTPNTIGEGDGAAVFYYDPIAVKPYASRTPEENKLFQEKYGFYKPVLPEPPKQISNEFEITKENMKYSPEDMLLLDNYKGLVLRHPSNDINLDKNLDEKLRRIKLGSEFVPDYMPLEPGYQIKPSIEDFNKMKNNESYRQEYYDKAMQMYLGKNWKDKIKNNTPTPLAKLKYGGKLYKEGGYLKDEDTYVTKEGKSTKRGLWANVYLKKKREGKLDMGEGGGIPDRYKEMGFSRVGQKKDSSRPGKKWMVLAKKDDDYKVVHGGYTGMKDFSQHGSEKRKKNFWNRMGGKDSAKATDPFSPLYWHKRIGTWAEGGKVENGEEQVEVEIEAEELVLRPQEDGSYEIVTETSEDAPTHEEGGVDITLQEGDLVFPKKYINKVKEALAKGEETGDYSDVDKLSEQMQKSAYKAYKDGKPYSSGGYNEELENQENQEKMEAKNGMKCKGGCKMGSGGKCMKCGGKSHKEGGMAYKYGGKFPDLTGDNKVTKADVLKGRGVFKKGGKAMKSCCMKAGGAVCKVCGKKKMSFGGALKK